MNLTEQLKEFDALGERRTQGEWYKFKSTTTASVMLDGTTDEVVFWTGFDSSHFAFNQHNNASFIAAAPRIHAAFKEAMRLLEQAREALQDSFESMCSEIGITYEDGRATKWNDSSTLGIATEALTALQSHGIGEPK